MIKPERPHISHIDHLPQYQHLVPKAKKKLVMYCCITGKRRVSTIDYVADRAKAFNITSEEYVKYYTCRDAIALLTKGTSIEDIRKGYPKPPTTNISNEDIEKIKKYNPTTHRVY